MGFPSVKEQRPQDCALGFLGTLVHLSVSLVECGRLLSDTGTLGFGKRNLHLLLSPFSGITGACHSLCGVGE